MGSKNTSSEFMTLAQSDQQNRHRAVLAAACELFVSKDDPSREDQLHFEELCLRLFPKLDLQAKTTIAERLAPCAATPKAVAMMMAKEDICVAAPLLNQFAGFSADDLLTILANGDELHALAISGRQNLADKVTLALSRKALPIFDAATNASRETKPAPEVSKRVKSSESTRARLDMDVDVDESIEALKTISIKMQTKHRVVAEQPKALAPHAPAAPKPISKLDQFLRMDHAALLLKVREIEVSAGKDAVNPAAILKQAYRRAERATDFVKLARGRDRFAFSKLLATECGLDERQTRAIVEDRNGFALASCLKSLALPAYTANEAFLLLNPSLGQDTEQVFLLDWFYGQITPSGARTLIDQWLINSPSDAAHQPVHQGASRSTSLEEGREKQYAPSAFAQKVTGNKG